MRRLLVYLNTLLLISLFFVLVTSSTYGQGGSSQAPGKQKKEDATQGQGKGQQQVTIGNVEEVRGNIVVVGGKKGKKTETVIDAITQVFGQDKKPLQANQIKPKDLVAIVSTVSGVATEGGKPNKAVKVFVKEATVSAASKRQGIQGLITGINGALITLVHQVQQERFLNLLTNENTVVKMKGVPDATIASLQLGMRIAAVGDLSEEGTLSARRIHVIPGKGKGLPEFVPQATPSATLTPTPTATASATPSATPTLTP